MPIIIAIAGPSGSGKTVLSNLLRDKKNCTELVSMTTREPRKGEINGKDYTFVDEKTFKEIEASGNLIESVFYNNRYYGIPAIEVENADKLGSPSVVVVDPIGIKNVQKYSESKGWTCISIFVNNPLNVLMERLEKRYENDCSNINPNDKNAELLYNKVKDIYLSRVESLKYEQENWVKPAYKKNNIYSIVIDKFNPENQEKILEEVYSLVENKLIEANVNTIKKNKKFGR